MKLPHIHFATVRNETIGHHTLQECRCGAKRTLHYGGRGYAAIPRDWPAKGKGWVRYA